MEDGVGAPRAELRIENRFRSHAPPTEPINRHRREIDVRTRTDTPIDPPVGVRPPFHEPIDDLVPHFEAADAYRRTEPDAQIPGVRASDVDDRVEKGIDDAVARPSPPCVRSPDDSE